MDFILVLKHDNHRNGSDFLRHESNAEYVTMKLVAYISKVDLVKESQSASELLLPLVSVGLIYMSSVKTTSAI